MREFRVTFGQKYAREVHPTFEAAHPDGWLTLVAVDEEAARRAAHNLLGRQWAFIYDLDDRPDTWALYPRGELGRATVTATVVLGGDDGGTQMTEPGERL